MRHQPNVFGNFDEQAVTLPAGRMATDGRFSQALVRSATGAQSSSGQQLPPAVPGARLLIESRAGRLAYYSGGRWHGRPLLLVHSVNAAASAAEMRPLFEHYASRRPVYALELPGFGSSERSQREYTPRLMTDAVLAMQGEIARLHGGVPIDAIALSLGSEFLARAAIERRSAFRSLALISPTGFDGGKDRYGAPAASLEVPWMRRLLRATRFGSGLFEQLVRPSVIRYFLNRSFGSPEINEMLHAYCVTTSHRPGAEHAPLAFLARQPFSADINAVYDDLTQPVWLAHGTRGSFHDVNRAQRLVDSGRWRQSAFDSGAMPHFQQTQDFIRRYEQFLDARVATGLVHGDQP